MNAGYRYNREAQAKALRAAVKNSKKDKVLYGAIIKTESGFGSTSNTISTQTGAQTISTQTNSSGSDDPNLLKKLQERALILDATVRPQDSVSNIGSPISIASTQSKAFSEPIDFKPKVDIGGPRIPLNLVDELKAKLTQGNFGLKPRDSRKPNVQIGTSSETSSVGTPTSSVPSNATSTIAPIDSKSPVAVNSRNRLQSNMTTSSDYSDSPQVSNSASATVGSATDMDLEEKGDLPQTEVLKVEILKRKDPKIQAAGLDLFDKLHADRVMKNADLTKSERFTARRSDGSTIPDRKIIMRLNERQNPAENWFSFIRYNAITGKEEKTIMNSPSEDGYDILRSIKEANVNYEKDLFRPNKDGTSTGLGVGSPDNIGSSRVIYKSNKGGNGVAKGQLYLMLPQLIKGHIRLYSKSGRPVVSRSNVSPQFQRIAKDIVDRNTFEADDYSNVDPKESADVNKFIEATKPIQPRNINRLSNADTIWQMKKRYEVLVGELSAGNHGKIVRDEMETILRNLIRLHALNQDKGRELIRSLRDF
jgi:hypothetical protein